MASEDHRAKRSEELDYPRTTLRSMLNTWNPLGVYDWELDYPPDEYDCLISPLLSRLQAGEGVIELSEYLWFRLKEHFGVDPARLQPDRFADTVVAWYEGWTAEDANA